MTFNVPDEPPDVVFPFERLRAYQAAALLMALTDPWTQDRRLGSAEMRDQLHRAALSVKLNIAEAVEEFSPPEKVRLLRTSRRSGAECAAVMDDFRRRGSVTPAEIRKARYLVYTCMQMITGIINAIEHPK